MKIRNTLSLLVVSTLLAFNANLALANDGHGDGDHGDGDGQGENDNCQGGHIDGSESLVATVVLVPSTNAPDGAGGYANLVSDNEDGVVTSALDLVITNLASGTYDLSIVRKSDGTNVDLGLFQVGAHGCRHHGDDGDDGEDDDNENGGGDWGGNCSTNGIPSCPTNGIVISHNDVQLPAGLDPMDVGQIIISDTNAVVILTGDFVTPAKRSVITYKAALRVQSGGTVTIQSGGQALATSTRRSGHHTDRFTLLASGVQPGTVFTVQVNGQKVGSVKSNKKGNVLVRKLPANLLTVRSVQLIDPNGTAAVKAKF